jgi:pullulanase
VNAATGRHIHLIGEGWNFGEVKDGARFVQASQAGCRAAASPASATAARRGTRRRLLRQRAGHTTAPGLAQRPVL